jgi:hypothetical protein
MKKILLATIIWTSAWCGAALAAGVPKIQFDQTVYDFGKTSQVQTVSGVFKFKNTGDGILKLEPPKPSCGCTVASLKPDTLPPGTSGELAFTLNLGANKTVMEKHIAVLSNDPQTPEVSLIIKVDYMPLYDIDPMTIAPVLAFGVNETEQFTTITRTDGKPLHLARLDVSKPWITAKVVPGAKAEDATARIRVTIQREGSARHFNEFIHLYTTEQTNTPIAGISIYGQVMGEVSLSPEALYWSVPNTTNTVAERPEALVLRRVTIRSADGKAIKLKNPQSTIKGIKVELVPKEAGKVYELVARLDDVPATSISGNLSVETSVASQPVIDVPVMVNVFTP